MGRKTAPPPMTAMAAAVRLRRRCCATSKPPGLEINFLFRNVRDDVMSATRSEQQPFVYGSLSKTAIYLKPGNSLSSAPLTQLPPAAISTPADEVLWDLVKGSEVAASFEEFLKRYPASARAKDARAKLDSLKQRQQAALPP